MFLFIAGVQPKTVRLEKHGGACPRCGHYGLFSKRTDRYLSLFFIPLFRVKTGTLFVSCDHCHSVFDKRGIPLEQRTPDKVYGEARTCPNCASRLEDDFDYCPRCGKKATRRE